MGRLFERLFLNFYCPVDGVLCVVSFEQLRSGFLFYGSIPEHLLFDLTLPFQDCNFCFELFLSFSDIFVFFRHCSIIYIYICIYFCMFVRWKVTADFMFFTLRRCFVTFISTWFMSLTLLVSTWHILLVCWTWSHIVELMLLRIFWLHYKFDAINSILDVFLL